MAEEAREDLRAMYLTKVPQYTVDLLVFLDERASNERTGSREWSPKCVDATAIVTT